MNVIDKIINQVIDAEGGYVNDPDDPGGETNFGITVKVARANGYMDEMEYMPRHFAEIVYRRKYISEPKFDTIIGHSELIAAEVIDTGVNCGQRTSCKFLQEVLNSFNLDGKLFPELTVDGLMGNKTTNALAAFLQRRGSEGEKVLHFTLNCRQVAYYMALKKDKFFYGWVKHRAYAQVKGEH